MMGGDDMEKIRVAVYCRVARDDTFSLEVQAAELRRYAEQAGYTIVSIMTEHGSGLTLDRPALKAVTEAVCKHKANMLIVKNLSRIGRDWGMVQEYIDFLNQHEVTLLCVSEGIKIGNNNLYPFSGHEKSGVSLQDT